MDRYRPDDLQTRRAPGEVLPRRVIDVTPLSVVDSDPGGPASPARRRFLRDVGLVGLGILLGGVASDRARPAQTQAVAPRQEGTNVYLGTQPEQVLTKAYAEAARLSDTLTEVLQYGGVVDRVGVLIGRLDRHDPDGSVTKIGRDPILLATANIDATDANGLLVGGFIGMAAPGEQPGTISVSVTDMRTHINLIFVPDNPKRPLRYLSTYASRSGDGRYQLIAFDPSGEEAVGHPDGTPIIPGLTID